MLPLSHIYVSTKVTKRKSPLLVFGSVLPDVSWTSTSEIGRDQIHYAPKELYEYVAKNCSQLMDLALGIRLHSNVDKGADYYSDDLEIGFAKVEGRKIESKTANLLGEEKSEKSLVLAHNFIEASVDMLLNESRPEILELYRKSVESIDLDEISLCLSKYLHLDKEVVSSEIGKFLNIVGPIAYVSKESFVDRMLILVKQRRGKDVDRDKTEKILQEAVELMKDKYQGYLDNAIENMRKDFSDLL